MNKFRNHVIWRIHNSWRPFCDRWWLHWLKFPLHLYRDLRDMKQRAFRGYADGDIWDLCSYHAGVTLGLLRHYREDLKGCPAYLEPDEYASKLDVIISGWEAMEELLSDEPFGEWPVIHNEWRSPREERWKKGMAEFIELYETLWV